MLMLSINHNNVLETDDLQEVYDHVNKVFQLETTTDFVRHYGHHEVRISTGPKVEDRLFDGKSMNALQFLSNYL